jgi:hypothetical protein
MFIISFSHAKKKRKIEKEKRQKGLTFSQSRSQMTSKIKKENAF